MSNQNLNKGNELEEALSLIESYIFQSNPLLKDLPITFEKKKIINLKGARSEIDLYVKIDHGKGYESVFIFECKNWNKKVGKNEVIVFADKIDGIHAQKGFFVGKNFTKNSIERAKNDGRIELIKINHDIIPKAFPIHFLSSRVQFDEILMKGDIDNRKYQFSEIFMLSGKPTSLKEVIDIILLEIDTDIRKSEPEIMLKEGSFIKQKSVEFDNNRLMFENKVVTGIRVTVTITVVDIQPIIKSQINIENRGRVYSLEYPDEHNRITMSTSLAQLD